MPAVKRIPSHPDGGISNGINLKSIFRGGIQIHHVHQEFVDLIHIGVQFRIAQLGISLPIHVQPPLLRSQAGAQSAIIIAHDSIDVVALENILALEIHGLLQLCGREEAGCGIMFFHQLVQRQNKAGFNKGEHLIGLNDKDIGKIAGGH